MKLVGVVGPTASGKTALAVHLAKRLNGEVVGVDASQIYRGMDIGTGKASNAELDGIQHHLLSFVDPQSPFDAAAYVRAADPIIKSLIERRVRPILCGGTGLYLRALLNGLCEAPPVPPEIRRQLQARIAGGELGLMHSELVRVDPELGARLNPNDKQRIERALGVYLTTKTPLSTWQNEHRFAQQRYDSVLVGLEWPRDVLNARIEERVNSMFNSGWLNEVSTLIEAGVDPQLASMKALGYSTIAEFLHGRITLTQAQEKTVVATRRYAKRQMTWFKANGRVKWFRGDTEYSVMVQYVREQLEE